MISFQGIVPDPDRLEVIYNYEAPKNQKQLQQILGFCNYYRRFVMNHNNFITPFRELLKKKCEMALDA